MNELAAVRILVSPTTHCHCRSKVSDSGFLERSLSLIEIRDMGGGSSSRSSSDTVREGRQRPATYAPDPSRVQTSPSVLTIGRLSEIGTGALLAITHILFASISVSIIASQERDFPLEDAGPGLGDL